MNLPDKIKENTVDENSIVKTYLTVTDKAINQLIDYLKEREENEYLPQYNLGTRHTKDGRKIKNGWNARGTME